MAEPVIRNACDRCRAQKLSCKRDNSNRDEPCERCARLKTECKLSPSLRNRKQQQQQQQLPQHHHHHQYQQPEQQQQPQQQKLPVSESSPTDFRSPKRRRTGSDPSLVTPDAVPRPDGLTSESHLAVTPDPVLDIGDFNFTFDHLGLLAVGQAEYLSHPELPGGGGHPLSHHHHHHHHLPPPLPLPQEQQQHHHHQPPLPRPLPHSHPPLLLPLLPPPPLDPGVFADSWDPPSATAAGAYPPVAPPPPDALPPPVAPPGPLNSATAGRVVPAHSTPGKRPRPRPRQIHLAADSGNPDTAPALHLTGEAPSIPWMAHLSDLNARLLDLASALPARNDPSLSRPTDERFKAGGFPIDDMFKLTRRVADALEQQPPPSDPSPPLSIDGSDPGNSMFVLATYMRLLDMYQKVFGLIRSELSQTSSGARFRFWKLPDVTVGSFAVESSPFLQMSLTIQVAEEFLERLRSSAARWPGAGAASASMFAGVVDISFQAFRDREVALAKDLGELRSDIERSLDS
ncbi:hypothetical protein AK830_g11752 [Neonectria ditissima]|uniref:Zn(2)-C6 fungal-type domain-containing protein n=1 Tax=Neonectria ditissima TaxID=78410 RepID=A0A0P7AC86_9HYPO|nr:hypothetical protein AK830_g11752 [Neonectria ditissima]